MKSFIYKICIDYQCCSPVVTTNLQNKFCNAIFEETIFTVDPRLSEYLGAKGWLVMQS